MINTRKAELVDAVVATERLGVNRATLYAYVSRGLIRSEPLSGDPRRRGYRAEDVASLIARKAQGRKAERVAEKTLDWGLPVMESAITLIERGALFYRGEDAIALARTATLEEAARLLWGAADDPFGGPAPDAPKAWPRVSRATEDASPIDRCLALLPLAGQNAAPSWGRPPARLHEDGATLLRRIVAAILDIEPTTEPAHRVIGAAWRLGASGTDLVRQALVLCADHELNASTFAVRVIASTGASLDACLIGGLAALSGPLHGGMTRRVEAFLDEVARDRKGDQGRAAIERFRRGDRLPGFGHPLYPDGDPRARALLDQLRPDASRDGLMAACEAAGGEPPNLDFALVATARALGLPRGSALALFAIGRGVGWIAHALEQRQSGQLIRPRSRYVGARVNADAETG